MKVLMQSTIAILAGAISQALFITYVAGASRGYETIACLLPRSWMTPILTLSLLSAPCGVVITLALAAGERQITNDHG